MVAAYRFGELVGVSTVRVHVADRPGGAAVTEQNQKLVDAFWVADVKTIRIRLVQLLELKTYSQNCDWLAFNSSSPAGQTYHVGVRKVSLRVSLVGAVHRGELDGIANEKYRLLIQVRTGHLL